MKLKLFGYAIGPLGSAMIGLITVPIITRYYSAEDIGRMSMLQVAINFFVLLFCLGLDQAYVREYHESESKITLLKTVTLPCIYLSIIPLSLAYIINPTFISSLLYDIDSSFLALVSILCLILSLISRFFSLILRMEERAFAYSLSQLLPKFLFLIFILSSLYFNSIKDSYNLISAHMLSITAVFIILCWSTRGEWTIAFRAKIEASYLKKLLLFGLPLIIGGLASWGLNVLDKIFLRGMSNFNELGVYSIATTLASGASILAGIFNIIWAPLVYKWVKDGLDLKKVDEISEYLLTAFYFIIVLSGLLSWIFPYLLPKEYHSVQHLITTCLFGPLLYTLSETTAIGITISRRTILSMLASVIAMLINAIGNFLLVPRLGAAGASVSTAISFGVFYVLKTEFSRSVWRKIPSKKAYSVIIILLTVSITNTISLKGSQTSVAIFLILFVLGFILFKETLHSLLQKMKTSA